MNLETITAISAIDGRYRSKVADLSPIASEYGLMRYRTQVECAWFAHLAGIDDIPQLPALNKSQAAALKDVYLNFTAENAARIKAIEATTNHDVKAVEYFVKETLQQIDGLGAYAEFVHFACTSEDINNLAYALMLKDARCDVMLPLMDSLIGTLNEFALTTAHIPMLAHTHGQPASPTALGKEIQNTAHRLHKHRENVASVVLLGKMNGAVGNYNAHLAAYPDIAWQEVSRDFVQSLGLEINPFTTQIEPHDYIAELFHALIRFNQTLLDFDQDVWAYIAIEYFGQKQVEGETGSSTMPHKVNPIDFENSEGNIGIANALLIHMASKLQVSRWQRDLSDSTVLRNIGSALGHCMVAYQATLKGLSRLHVNEAKIAEDLDHNWEVLGEAVQTVMRKYGMDEPYERLKKATRGKRLDADTFSQILTNLKLPPEAARELAGLTPATYVGRAHVSLGDD
ncbi:MAG: adenylosuccinate lyase [Proteobacteria bacterium]|nr:adenylosuccinate lyase [Pseudomonadota bacterium]